MGGGSPTHFNSSEPSTATGSARSGFGTPYMEHCSAAVSPFPHPWVYKNAEGLESTDPGDGSGEDDEGDRPRQIRIT